MSSIPAGVKLEMMPPGPTQLPLANPRREMLSLQEFLGPIEKAGGSMQLVCNRIEKETQEVFAQRLSAFFEPTGSQLLQQGKMQMEDNKEHIVRLVHLGCVSLATTKGPHRLHTCLSIADSVFTDGSSPKVIHFSFGRTPKRCRILTSGQATSRATRELALRWPWLSF